MLSIKVFFYIILLFYTYVYLSKLLPFVVIGSYFVCVALTEQLMTNGNISRARASHFPTEEKLVQVLALYKIAENPVPDTLYPSRGNMDHVPGTLYRIPCTGYLGPLPDTVPCTGSLGPCTGYLVPETLDPVPDNLYRVP